MPVRAAAAVITAAARCCGSGCRGVFDVRGREGVAKQCHFGCGAACWFIAYPADCDACVGNLVGLGLQGSGYSNYGFISGSAPDGVQCCARDGVGVGNLDGETCTGGRVCANC